MYTKQAAVFLFVAGVFLLVFGPLELFIGVGTSGSFHETFVIYSILYWLVGLAFLLWDSILLTLTWRKLEDDAVQYENKMLLPHSFCMVLFPFFFLVSILEMIIFFGLEEYSKDRNPLEPRPVVKP